MNNSQVTEIAAIMAEDPGFAEEKPEKYPNRFRPGQSGNPAGRPKKTKEEELQMERLKKLTPTALDQMEKMLKSDRIAALAKVRLIEIILERTFGKVESAVKVTNTQESIESAQAELEAIFGTMSDASEGGVVH